jgi:hypothetical protein
VLLAGQMGRNSRGFRALGLRSFSSPSVAARRKRSQSRLTRPAAEDRSAQHHPLRPSAANPPLCRPPPQQDGRGEIAILVGPSAPSAGSRYARLVLITVYRFGLAYPTSGRRRHMPPVCSRSNRWRRCEAS